MVTLFAYVCTVAAFLMGVIFGRMMRAPYDSERGVDNAFDRLAA